MDHAFPTVLCTPRAGQPRWRSGWLRMRAIMALLQIAVQFIDMGKSLETVGFRNESKMINVIECFPFFSFFYIAFINYFSS